MTVISLIAGQERRKRAAKTEHAEDSEEAEATARLPLIILHRAGKALSTECGVPLDSKLLTSDTVPGATCVK